MLIVRALLAIALICCSGLAWSGDPEVPQTTASKQEGKAEKTGTKESPFFVNGEITTKKDKKEASDDAEDRQLKAETDAELVKYTKWLSVFTFLLFLFTAALWIVTLRLSRDARLVSARQAKETKESLRLSRESFLSAHRPRLRVRNIDIWQITVGDSESREKAPVPVYELFTSGQKVSGTFYISNVGDSAAKNIKIGAWVEWMQGGLPMSRPYEGKYPLPEVIEKIAPGSTQTAGFISERPMDEMGTLIRNGAGYWHLYVMGWVDYFDELGTRRRTAFCREFIPNKGRFFPVSDPDYEHEE